MQSALSPSLKSLVDETLLGHTNVDVKVAVASCISEITRITAPDAPYDDDQMKEVFRLIVSSFENLCDKSSRSYTKRTSILETVAKVRSCVVMLDLECDTLILEMFQHFLNAISPTSFGSGGIKGDDGVPGRVRVAIRLRPRNAEELATDAILLCRANGGGTFSFVVSHSLSFLKWLKLSKNNWDSDTYEFDEVLTKFASQKRVYEVVAKPVVESVLDGYNGTVMAYGRYRKNIHT
ncbi:sister chromatid cohesion protein PDS5 [Cannabis sativa]|uniref:sister chromatid cohesion protein PDS5 n=1 Tax=Cannabis sativa TaxID=3483 RepID=UPI0029CA714D|nr:sister chromatid cohesion protein PDS5 [Cannabis sativa]